MSHIARLTFGLWRTAHGLCYVRLVMDATVFLVEDDRAVRDSVCDVLSGAGYHVVAFASAEEFLQLTDVPLHEVSCLLVDVCLPSASGVELQRCLVSRGAIVPTVFMTGYDDVPTTVMAMKDGAIDFLRKPVSAAALLAAVELALVRSARVLAEARTANDLQRRLARLTQREHEVFTLVARGFLNKQIAARLGVSMATVKAHRGRLTRKLAVDSIADLVRLADRVEMDPHPDRPWSNGDHSPLDVACV